ERGLEPDKDPYAVALVLTREPPAIAPELTAREIESLEEMEAAMAVQWEAFDASPEEIEEARGLLPDRFRQRLYLRHAVWLDGEIVCTGTAAATEHVAPLRRRYEGRCAGPRRLPCADPGTLGRCRR